MDNLTQAMNTLEKEISRQQAYIRKHGDSNDAGEYDEHWESYKEDAEFNLKKWDDMKLLRDGIMV